MGISEWRSEKYGKLYHPEYMVGSMSMNIDTWRYSQSFDMEIEWCFYGVINYNYDGVRHAKYC